ncbi:GyrI-like domain-containing protein [Flavobacterium oreochromis]|uniref:GyrI-like domain-containing protein n=1 Tax=Flavobacterium oreochromis TaxID=2906078 RepID=A0ABW8PC20_9FLAO|nr:GyrI-like domain-containing protein [Flavobacterium oreochromis]OWP74321.1 AraC family transcriptional regulator [Flavobacterium oreochromis]
MKVAKYLFLLALLLTGTIAVFVATKDGKYTIQHEKLIDVSKEIAFKYMSDRANWDSINPWKDEKYQIIQTKKIPNESITQEIILNGVKNELVLNFQDTLKNKTKTIWSTKGELTFKDKFLSIIGKGVKNDFEDRFESALNFVNTTLTREINSFNIKLDGFVKRDTLYYIQRPVISKKEQIPLMIKHFVPKLQKILTSTNTTTNGDPFIVYHAKDSLQNKFKYSIAIPVKKKIYTSSDSDILSGQINPSSTVKATVKGNYIHLVKALPKIYAFMKKNKLEQSDKYREIEILTKNITTASSTSSWITEIYIPVRPIKIAIKANPVKKDTVKIVNDSHENPLK